MARPEISVVTVTHGRLPVLLDKAEALRRQTLEPASFEWIVVANGDPAGAAALRSAELPFPTDIVESDTNLPIGAARNLAAARASAPVLLMSDDDCLPNPEALAGHLRAHRETGGEAVVVAPLRLPDALRVGAQREPFERSFHLGRRALWINATGANTSLPRPAFEAVGGYDESFVDYGGEDPDLALRLRRRGARFRYEPTAWAYHVGRVLGQDPERAYLAGRAHRRIFDRDPSLEVGVLLGVHPWLLAAKRWLLSGPARRLLPDEVRVYERAYLEGASGWAEGAER